MKGNNNGGTGSFSRLESMQLRRITNIVADTCAGYRICMYFRQSTRMVMTKIRLCSPGFQIHSPLGVPVR